LSVSARYVKGSLALCRYIQYDVSSPVVPVVSFSERILIMRLVMLLVLVSITGCHAVEKVALKAIPKDHGRYEFALEFTPKR